MGGFQAPWTVSDTSCAVDPFSTAHVCAPDFADLVQGMNGSAVGRSLHDGGRQVVGRTDWRALEIDGMGAKKGWGREAGVGASNTRSFLYHCNNNNKRVTYIAHRQAHEGACSQLLRQVRDIDKIRRTEVENFSRQLEKINIEDTK